jgi:hypothetical protein
VQREQCLESVTLSLRRKKRCPTSGSVDRSVTPAHEQRARELGGRPNVRVDELKPIARQCLRVGGKLVHPASDHQRTQSPKGSTTRRLTIAAAQPGTEGVRTPKGSGGTGGTGEMVETQPLCPTPHPEPTPPPVIEPRRATDSPLGGVARGILQPTHPVTHIKLFIACQMPPLTDAVDDFDS